MVLTHIDEYGNARMVSVEEKGDTMRVAIASGCIQMQPETLNRIRDGGVKKGDVLTVAQVAGIMASKRTSELIPMCHPLFLTGVDLHFEFPEQKSEIRILATAKTVGKTGVEMEALTAVSVAALTIYDMCKAMDRSMVIGSIQLEEKTGGKSGQYRREEKA